MVKLPESATEDDYLALLGVLNSSTACFWLKQVSHDKGNRGGERSTARFAWENFYEFTGTKLEQFPLPERYRWSLGVNSTIWRNNSPPPPLVRTMSAFAVG